MSLLAELLEAAIPAAIDATVAKLANSESDEAEVSQDSQDSQPTGLENTDSATWPHGTAWSAMEVQTFQERTVLFAWHGKDAHEAETLAEQLLKRDRDGDERRLCLECVHYLRGRCNNWRGARFAGADNQLGQLATILHRCPGFASRVSQAQDKEWGYD